MQKNLMDNMKTMDDIFNFWRLTYYNTKITIEFSKSDSYMFVTIRDKQTDEIVAGANGLTYQQVYENLVKTIVKRPSNSSEIPGLH